jgi:hypothetical protein
MKKILLAGMIYCGLFLTQYSYSQDAGQAVQDGAAGGQEYWSHNGKDWNAGPCAVQGKDEPCEDHACAPADRQMNDCYCLYAHYEPCYYYTKRCVTENKYSCVKRCRQVPKYYEVQRCKMVPQYYCEKVCKYEPEYYEEQVCTPCQKWVCDKHVKYVPRYYYKHVCGKADCNTPCPR